MMLINFSIWGIEFLSKRKKSKWKCPSNSEGTLLERGFLWRSRLKRVFAAIVQVMPDCQDGMSQQHARTREAHDISYAGAHIGLIAMDRAIDTGGFTFLKRTVIKSIQGIIFQLPAGAA